MLSAVLSSNVSYIIIAPFLPLKFKEKGVDGDVIGIIFAAYPVSSIVSSLILAKHSSKITPYTAMSYGLFVMGLCFTSFGLLNMITSSTVTSIIAILIRIF